MKLSTLTSAIFGLALTISAAAGLGLPAVTALADIGIEVNITGVEETVGGLIGGLVGGLGSLGGLAGGLGGLGGILG